jgi:hypothetical protein
MTVLWIVIYVVALLLLVLCLILPSLSRNLNNQHQQPSQHLVGNAVLPKRQQHRNNHLMHVPGFGFLSVIDSYNGFGFSMNQEHTQGVFFDTIPFSVTDELTVTLKRRPIISGNSFSNGVYCFMMDTVKTVSIWQRFEFCWVQQKSVGLDGGLFGSLGLFEYDATRYIALSTNNDIIQILSSTAEESLCFERYREIYCTCNVLTITEAGVLLYVSVEDGVTTLMSSNFPWSVWTKSNSLNFSTEYDLDTLVVSPDGNVVAVARSYPPVLYILKKITGQWTVVLSPHVTPGESHQILTVAVTNDACVFMYDHKVSCVFTEDIVIEVFEHNHRKATQIVAIDETSVTLAGAAVLSVHQR